MIKSVKIEIGPYINQLPITDTHNIKEFQCGSHFKGFHLWSVGFKARKQWWRDLGEESCLAHGGREVKEGPGIFWEIMPPRPAETHSFVSSINSLGRS